MAAMAVTVALTLAEASQVLNPPLSERQLRQIIGALGWQPSGHRRNGRRGHPVFTYAAADLLALHAAVSPFIALGSDHGHVVAGSSGERRR